VQKHLTKCGKPQEARNIPFEYALSRITTRETGALVLPPDWHA
jgi:hypothetical protein